MNPPVVTSTSAVLAHTPGLASHGSEPSRLLPSDPAAGEQFLASLRSFDDAVGYPPHQAFIGRLHPRDLPPRPRVGQRLEGAQRWAPGGEVMPEEEFLGLLAATDGAGVLTLDATLAEDATARLAHHPLTKMFDLDRVHACAGDARRAAAAPGALPIRLPNRRLVGAVVPIDDGDEALDARVLLESLVARATGGLALGHLLADHGIDPETVDYVLTCAEEGVGDRGQRGGNLATAVAELVGLQGASGADVRSFCAAPVPTLVLAGSLVASGAFRNVAVVAGGSLAKLGTGFPQHVHEDQPILGDVVGGVAALVSTDDGESPQLRLDSVGRQEVGNGTVDPFHALAAGPLEQIGLAMTDVDDFAADLTDPDVDESRGDGDVAAETHRSLAHLAARRGDIDAGDVAGFVDQRGVPGYAPAQGHLASALCYLPHALQRLTTGAAARALLLATGSRLPKHRGRASDGMSVLLERNAANPAPS